MFVAGIDYSTRGIDTVLIDVDDILPPRQFAFPLSGQDAWERTREVRGWSLQLSDDVLAVGLEQPRGHGSGALYRVQGALLSRIPRWLLVQPWIPSEWRRMIGLPGNAAKGVIENWVKTTDPTGSRDGWTQDACDAYCIALATASAISASTSLDEFAALAGRRA
mgnify:CR=1 FL=1